jgi:hypothetical protein
VVSGKGDKTLWQYGTQFEYLRESMIPGKKLTVENDDEPSENMSGRQDTVRTFSERYQGTRIAVTHH